MGDFVTNVHVHAPGPKALEEVEAAIRAHLRAEGYIEAASGEPCTRGVALARSGDEWVAVFDEAAAKQDPEVVGGLAKALSGVGRAAGVVVHDGDLLVLTWYEDGRKKRARKPPQGASAMDDLAAVAAKEGWGAETCTLSHDVLEDAEVDGLRWLRFRHEHLPEWEKRREGPPVFVFENGVFRTSVDVTAGEPFQLTFEMRNEGGPWSSIAPIVSGPALDQGLVTIEKVGIAAPVLGERGLIELPAEARRLELAVGDEPRTERDVRLVVFEGIGLPGGLVDPESVQRARPGERDEAEYAYRRSTFRVSIAGQAVKTGRATLHAFCVAAGSSDGRTSAYEAEIAIRPAARRPLRAVGDSADAPYLRMLEEPKTVIGLVAFDHRDEAMAEAVGDALEKWCEVMSRGDDALFYYLTPGEGPRPRASKLLAFDKVPRSKQWRDLRAALSTCEGFSSTRRHGFSFDLSRERPGEVRIPFLAPWLQIAEGHDADRAEDELAAIFDALAERTEVLQAFVGRWAHNVTSHSTLYEQVCGIHASGSLGRAWCGRWLRGVTGRLWLGRSLVEALGGAERLAGVADTRPVGSALSVRLAEGRSLDDLEAALAPILPGAADYAEFCRRG